ncbi:carbohydrate-binding protein [Microbacterium sp. EST19A]|uniref:carbohydrate-binding protein n=1 Tax=Microbacterium sp. EST19A TaxID=2862681 RepID=UPI001CC0F125|nr:carbohydrate-binding protein [Microbacterium sp. EST19A]
MKIRRVIAIAAVSAIAVGGCAGILTPPAASASVLGRTLYVAKTGDDSHSGSSSSPYLTIQHCAEVARPGDTCVIAEGTYRETVTPGRSGTALLPITFQAASGAHVVIDGSDQITGWEQVDAADLADLIGADPGLSDSEFAASVTAGTVYRVDAELPTSLPGQQIFIDDSMAPEAAWPHAGDDPAHAAKSHADWGTQTQLGDDALSQPEGYWVGARLLSHNWFVSETGRVTSSAPGSVTVDGLPSCVGLSPNTTNYYALSGKLALLGRDREWHYDDQADALYVRIPDGDPEAVRIEAKQREFGFDLSGRSYVNVIGVGLKGTSILTSASTTHVTLDGVSVRYVSEYADLGIDPNTVTPSDPCDVLTAGETTSGIQLHGSDNVLRNSSIAYSAGNGVVVTGERNTVLNNVITDTDYMGSYAAGVNLLGTDNSVMHNTITGTGRSSINIDNKVAGYDASGHRIGYNDLSHYGKLVHDVGAVYVCCRVDLGDTLIDHNTMRDAAPVSTVAPAPGVYLDLETINGVVADNVTWNRTTYGVVLINPNGGHASGTKVINNTSGTDRKALSLFGGTYEDIEVTNNLGDVDSATGVTLAGNVPNDNAAFTNPATHDFTVGENSPARNAATTRPPYSDGSVDAAPTAGAYQYGAPTWRSGATLTGSNIEAESFSASSGTSTRPGASGTVVGSFDGGDWVSYAGVDFGDGRDLVRMTVATDDPYENQEFEIRIDAADGPVIGQFRVDSTAGFDKFSEQFASISPTSGIHDVFVKAIGWAGVGDLDSLAFLTTGTHLEAESAFLKVGTSTAAGGTGTVVTGIDRANVLVFRDVDFGAGRSEFLASIASDATGAKYAVRLDSLLGTKIGTLSADSTGSTSRFETRSTNIAATAGVHDVYLIPSGGRKLGALDWVAMR